MKKKKAKKKADELVAHLINIFSADLFEDVEKEKTSNDKILLTVEIDGDRYTIRNYYNGKLNESYAQSTKEQATINMVALLNGFQPPRGLKSRDIPAH